MELQASQIWPVFYHFPKATISHLRQYLHTYFKVVIEIRIYSNTNFYNFTITRQPENDIQSGFGAQDKAKTFYVFRSL